MPRSQKITGFALALLGLASVYGCSGDGVTGPATPARVEVTPGIASLTSVGQTRQFSAVARDAAGNRIDGQTFTWTSSATSVATVSATGQATAVGNGNATITAAVAGVSGTAALSVSQAISTVEVSPGSLTLTALGASQQFSAVAKDANDNPIGGLEFEWSSSAPSVATISATGLVTAASNGATTITATAGGVTGTASLGVSQAVSAVEVSPGSATLTTPGETRQFSALAKDANGNTIGGLTFSWLSSVEAVATISATGLATAVGNGGTTISATTADSSGTASLTVELPRFASVASGGNHTCGVTADGVAYCWGRNTDGQLGDGTTTNRTTPVAVSGSLRFLRFTSLSAGFRYTCGVATGDNVYCWGHNNAGQLGDGTTTDRTTPVHVGVFKSVSAGGAHTCGPASGGVGYCWGANTSGQLGNGTTVGSPNPVAVSSGLGFSSVSGGLNHTCGVAGGTAYCWGWNLLGQLGDGTTNNRTTPAGVLSGATWAAVSAGNLHTCGVTTGGVGICFGENTSGQLGDGSTTGRLTPVAVSGGYTFASLSAGGGHTCGLATNGTTYCWGSNTSGQLGDGTSTNRLAPVAVLGGLSIDWLSGGDSHTCAVTADGSAYCWGKNSNGQLGDGSTANRTAPVRVMFP
jgi:alpha-tubulin suppressor-like RCC1 family protein